MKSLRNLFVCLLCLVAPLRAQLAVNELAGFGAGGDAELGKWVNRVTAAGGTFAADSIPIARALLAQLRGRSYNAKIVYLLPLLGGNLAAARVPLRDALNVGIASNTSFVDGDFSQSTGLQGNGSSKILDLLVKPSQLGTGNNGGLGYWETNVSFSGSAVEPMGTYNDANTNRFVLDLRNTVQAFSWGSYANNAGTAVSAPNGHYYGQRSGATSRELFRGGSSLATETTSDATSGAANRNIRLMGADYGPGAGGVFYWAGRCAVAYLTDGTLTSGEVSDLHALLGTYLITPTGR